MNSNSRALSASNLPPSNLPIAPSNIAIDHLQPPHSPTAVSMKTNPSASNPMHQNTSEFTHLPNPALNQYDPQSARHPQSPTLSNSGFGFNLSPPQKKSGRSTSMGMPSSIPAYFDHSYNNPLSSAAGSAVGNSTYGVSPAPTSIPPDLGSLQQPAVRVSSIDSSEPKMFPGVLSKSRQSDVTNRRVSSDQLDGNDGVHEAMSSSMASIGRVRSEGAASVAITEEDAIAEEDASDESD